MFRCFSGFPLTLDSKITIATTMVNIVVNASSRRRRINIFSLSVIIVMIIVMVPILLTIPVVVRLLARAAIGIPRRRIRNLTEEGSW